MRKVYLSNDETVVRKTYLENMERRAQAEAAYRQAVDYMTGYMQETRRQLEATADSHVRARLRGRIEAVASFDKAVLDADT